MHAVCSAQVTGVYVLAGYLHSGRYSIPAGPLPSKRGVQSA